MTERPLVSTLVLNWNGAHLLDDCLVTLAAQDWPAHEVVVVDNGSGDDSAAVTARHPARWLPMGDNLGFTRAYNRAVRDAKGELLFFVNNDMRFEPDCVGRLARALAADDTLFAADPTQRSWDGARVIHGRTRFVPGSYHDIVVPPWAVEYTAAATASRRWTALTPRSSSTSRTRISAGARGAVAGGRSTCPTPCSITRSGCRA